MGCDIDVHVGDDVSVTVEVVRDKPVLDAVTDAVPVNEGCKEALDVGSLEKLVLRPHVVGAADVFEYTEKTLPLKPS